MADDPTIADKTLKEQYVPFEQRDSQNVQPKPYIKLWASIVALTAVGGILGYFTGKTIEPRKIKLHDFAAMKFGTKHADRQAGTILGAEIGAIYGAFHHWKYKEGRHLGVQNISSNLKTVIEPAELEAQATKETALVTDLKKLDEKFSVPVSHSASVLTRREAENRQESNPLV